MTLKTLLDIARKYRSLGDAVSEQLDSVVADKASVDEQNPNALRRGLGFLKDAANQISPDEFGDDALLEQGIRENIEDIELAMSDSPKEDA